MKKNRPYRPKPESPQWAHNAAKLMAEKGWSATELAGQTETSVPAMYKWLNGRQSCHPWIVQRIADALGTTPEDLAKFDKLSDAAREAEILSVRIPSKLAEELEQVAEQIERSKGWVVKRALMDWLGRNENQFP